MKFSDLKLTEKTLRSISYYGYKEATEVQEKAIPRILEGVNLIVRSQTGTGKTAAFGIGIIERIVTGKSNKALILAPTRELAIQVCTELRALSKLHGLKIYPVYGGQSINVQASNIQRGYHILVATPGRLLDLYRRRVVDLFSFDTVVLDEADHMLDLGFQDDVLAILSKLPKEKIMLLFSATVDSSIRRISSNHMPNSEMITIGEIEVVSTIKQEHVEITQREKFSKFIEILNSHPKVKTLVFMKTKRSVAWLKDKLEQRGFRNVGMLQGDMTQARRNKVLTLFKDGVISVLVATNVAARGLHIDDVDLIINYDQAETEEMHLHRVGRTGRMGLEGKVVNFVQKQESSEQRMSDDHPDFAWMKQGTGRSHQSRSRNGPRSRNGRRPRGRGKPDYKGNKKRRSKKPRNDY